MDHIVRCMLDVDSSDHELDLDLDTANHEHGCESAGYIEKRDSPTMDLQQQQLKQQAPLPPPPADEKPFMWRMHSQTERKYQLFPKDKQQQPAAGKSLDPEQAFVLAMGGAVNGTAQNSIASSTTSAPEKAAPGGSGLRLRIKEHTLIRRRKVSVPELGPMTTVQEVAMDSPTIPGRPPIHERSISAPGNSWKQHHLIECILPQTSFYDDIPEQSVYVSYDSILSSSPIDVPRCNSAQAVLSPSTTAAAAKESKAAETTSSSTTSSAAAHISLRLPLSPKNLTPLVIPPPHSHAHAHRHHYQHHQASSSLSGSLSGSSLRPSGSATTPHSSQSSRFRSGSTPIESALRSARSDESPRTRTPFTPFTPLSAVSNASTLPTPVSATSTTASIPASTTSTTSTIQPPTESSRASPKPWTEGNYTVSTPKDNAENSKAANASNAGNVTPAPVETSEPRSAPPQSASAASAAASAILKSIPSAASILGHRRGQSESGSIMERGRPRKRSASREGTTSAAINAMVAAGISVAANTGATTQATTQAATSTSTTATNTTTGTSTSTVTATVKRSASKASKSAERRAFELLPRGYKASEAPAVLGANEAAALATQALQQAARFEVLRKEDVDSLSRELRNLDDRTEYLRRTYTSLRAGRRNLHGRICQYLRSPRVAKFSHDSMLKQEEALAELDTSIDDWVTKLEQAENRRTRVRQKLLEHVAAAATLPLTSSLAAAAVAAAGLVPSTTTSTSPSASTGVVGSSESLQLAMGIKPPSPLYANNANSGSGMQSISTPPRSPTKVSFQTTNSSSAVSAAANAIHASIISPVASCASPSPQRPIVAQVPSTILEQPLVEEAMASLSKSMMSPSTPTTQTSSATKPLKSSTASVLSAITASPLSPANTLAGGRRVDVESIRVYAGDDVYALLADVENQITQMGVPAAAMAASSVPATSTTASAQDYFSLPRNAALSDDERKRLHRAHSQELLNGGGSSSTSKRSTPTPPASPLREAATISRPESPADSVEIFLTSAVFRPERSILAV